MTIRKRIETLINNLVNCDSNDVDYEKNCLELKLCVVCNMQEIPEDLRDQAFKIIESYDEYLAEREDVEINESGNN